MRHLLLLVALAGCADAYAKPATGSITGTVTLKTKDGKVAKAAPTVIYLQNVPGAVAVPKDHAVIKQKEKQFEPPLTIVVKGTTIDFPNEDKIFHNVFSVSRPARFDLGLYKSGAMKSVEMKRTGVVDVYCNIHPNMVAKVVIVDNAFFTVSDQGAFTIKDVPPGEYPIVAWLPSGDEATGTATVKAGEATKVALEVVESGAAAAEHTRKDGTPYGRYK